MSYHLPIYLEFSCADCKPKAPYKFNSTWLKNEGYFIWLLSIGRPTLPHLANQYLKFLPKKCSPLSNWAKEKRHKDEHTLIDTKVELANLVDRDGRGFVSMEAKERLIKLEADRNRIMKDREETWRLRSHVI